MALLAILTTSIIGHHLNYMVVHLYKGIREKVHDPKSVSKEDIPLGSI